MLYLMKQKIWSIGDQYTIQDAAGSDVFRVRGQVFSMGDKLAFEDMNGQELAFIRQRLLHLRPTYEIYRGGQLFAEVVRELSLFKSRFSVDVPGPNDYEIRGNFLAHEFEFYRSGRSAARVSKEYFSWSDTYGVETAAGEDDVTILATAVVIDLVCHDGDD